MKLRFGSMDAPAPGIYFDIPEQEYRAWDAVSWSSLSWMVQSPGIFKGHLEHSERFITKDTEELLLKGRIFHTYLLEPDVAKQVYLCKPETYPSELKGEIVEKPWNMNANYCKDWVRQRAAEGYEIVSASMLAHAIGQAANARQVPEIMQIIDGAKIEVAVVWIDSDTGLLCKARLDALKGGQIGEAKSTGRSAEWESWMRTVQARQYWGQAAFYRDGHDAIADRPELPIVRFLVVESKYPYRATYYDMMDHPEAVSYQCFIEGRWIYHSYLQQLAYAMKNDHWPMWAAQSDGEMVIPEWMRLQSLVQ